MEIAQIADDFTSDVKHSWCPGCGDVVILQSMKKALKQLAIPKEQIVFVSGIGCGSKFPHYLTTYGLETLHGRALPNATGVAIANPKLTVIAIGGDGDGYGIGMGHFIHTCRRNLKLTYIVQNNEVYGLTKGQSSPTSPKGFVSPTTPSGTIEIPVNGLAMAITAGATFVARGYSMDPNHLSMLMTEAIKHRGFAVIDVLQTCPTWNKDHDIEFYRGHIYKLENEQGYDRQNKTMALAKTLEDTSKRIPIGILYQNSQDRELYTDDLFQESKQTLTEHDLRSIDIDPILEEYR